MGTCSCIVSSSLLSFTVCEPYSVLFKARGDAFCRTFREAFYKNSLTNLVHQYLDCPNVVPRLVFRTKLQTA